MKRNRESAALSRTRKKAYIEELEAKCARLAAAVQELQSENAALKQERNAMPRPPTADVLSGSPSLSTPASSEIGTDDASDEPVAPVLLTIAMGELPLPCERAM